MRNLILTVLMVLSSQAVNAGSLSLGLLGATYGSDLKKEKAFVRPEFSLTAEKDGAFFNFTVLDIEKNENSFSMGMGYQTEVAKDLYVGGMIGALFKRSYDDRSDEKGSMSIVKIQNYLPYPYQMGFLPWVTLSKDFKISESYSLNSTTYVNHLAVHSTIGVKYEFGK